MFTFGIEYWVKSDEDDLSSGDRQNLLLCADNTGIFLTKDYFKIEGPGVNLSIPPRNLIKVSIRGDLNG